MITFLKYGFRMKEQNVTAGLKGLQGKPTNATPDCSLAKCAPESLRSLLTLVTGLSCRSRVRSGSFTLSCAPKELI